MVNSLMYGLFFRQFAVVNVCALKLNLSGDLYGGLSFLWLLFIRWVSKVTLTGVDDGTKCRLHVHGVICSDQWSNAQSPFLFSSVAPSSIGTMAKVSPQHTPSQDAHGE